jgi:hypothetical protein
MVPLLLAANDWLGALLPILFAVFWLINKLIATSKAANQQARKIPRRPGEPVAPAAQPKQPGPAPPKQSQLNAEIERFLKRASGQRSERARREAAPPPQQAQRRSVSPPTRKPLSEQGPAGRRGFDSVADSVDKHLADRGFENRAEHLADDIVKADQQMEQHLQKAFNRRVGTLSDNQTEAAGPVTDVTTAPELPASSSAAASLSALLSNPQSIKQAIILNEILARPEHRW